MSEAIWATPGPVQVHRSILQTPVRIILVSGRRVRHLHHLLLVGKHCTARFAFALKLRADTEECARGLQDAEIIVVMIDRRKRMRGVAEEALAGGPNVQQK